MTRLLAANDETVRASIIGLVESNTRGGQDAITHCGDDGALWAEAFCKRNPAIDVGMMMAWFCNAIEAACDVREARRKRTWCETLRKKVREFIHA